MKRKILWIVLILIIIGAVIAVVLINQKGECAKAGESSSFPYPDFQTKKCCKGLVEINGCYAPHRETGECGYMVGCGGICSDCGNNNCETWENKCNCPEDCS